MSRGGTISNRRFSCPVIKKEPDETSESSQIMNLTSIFSSPSYRSNQTLTHIKDETGSWDFNTYSQGLTPSGHSYRPLAENSPSARSQVSY